MSQQWLRITQTSLPQETSLRSTSTSIPFSVSSSPIPQPRLLCFDLENRPLGYWYEGKSTSQITAFGWKYSDRESVSSMLLRPDGWYDVYSDDQNICRLPAIAAHEDFAEKLRTADVAYGHNIRSHDLPLVNAWLLRLQLPVLRSVTTLDTFRDLPKTADLSKSLENMADLYDLQGEKFKMSLPKWELANQLTDKGIDLARRRVTTDVLLQEELYHKLKELNLIGAPRAWTSRRTN